MSMRKLKFQDLYPEYVKYIKIVDNFPSKGISSEYLDEFRIFKEFFMDNNEKLALVTKKYPHSMLDMMLISLNNRCSISEFSPTAVNEIMNICYLFIKFISIEDYIKKFSLNNGYAYIVFNYDANTTDRESGMSVKRFHIHLNYWRENEINMLSNNFKKINDISVKNQKRLLDPISYIGGEIIQEIIEKIGFKKIEVIKDRKGLEEYPPGCIIKLKNGWNTLIDKEFSEFLINMHCMLDKYYTYFRKEFTQEDVSYKPWERPKLLNRNRINEKINDMNISRKSKDNLIKISELLKNVSKAEIDYFKKHKAIRINNLSLNGLAYSVAFYVDEFNEADKRFIKKNNLYMIIRPTLFSDIGGAGLMGFPGFPVTRICRSQGVLSKQEHEIRFQYQNEFMEFLERKGEE